ncbi:quinon protein alcohol dehydrogenase-like superfamily [Butyriboletus roseoflavus]|nr:quinon protein alcohol dehydrogenase-like superfamily [Butyriboletus roseoflavus]
MSLTKTDHTIVLNTGRSNDVAVVAFQADGMHVLGRSDDKIHRWRLADGQVVGKQAGMNLYAISASRDHKWVVCGTYSEGASVWDAEIQEKVIDVEGKNWVYAVDVSADSARFATGAASEACIWSITSGERLVGPLKHDKRVLGVRFSPNGEQIATVCQRHSVRVFNSNNGDQLIEINTIAFSTWTVTPLAWSNDGQRIFIISNDKKIKSFSVSTGSQLAESPILDDDHCISLAGNGKFIASVAYHAISFLDTSTLAKIGTAIEDGKRMSSSAISSDSSRIATGRGDGTVIVHNLANFLPDSYGPFHASREEQQPDEQPSASDGHENKLPGSEPSQGNPIDPNLRHAVKSGDSDLLEVDVPSSTPGAQFDWGESLSTASSTHSRDDEPPPDDPSLVRSLSPASSTHPRDDKPPLVEPSHSILQSSGAIPVTSCLDARPEDHLDTGESSQRRSIFKWWPWMKNSKDPASHKPDRPSTRSRDPRPRPRSPARENTTGNEGPSTMAAGQRVRRAVARPVVQGQKKSRKKPTAHNHSHKDTSRAGQGASNPNEAGSVCLLPVIVVPVTTAHFLSGAARKRSVSTISREGPCNGARIFLLLMLLDPHWITSARIRRRYPYG